MNLYDLVIKDTKVILYDIKSLAIILIMPIVLMSILGMSLQGVFGDEAETGVAMAHIGVVKAYDLVEEMDKVAGRIDLTTIDPGTIDGLNAEKNFFGLLDNEEIQSFLSYELMSEAQGLQALEEGDITALIRLPKNFIYNSYMILTGSRLVSEIGYVVNPENDFFASIVLGIIDSYADMTNHIYAQQRMMTMTLLSSGNIDAMDGVMSSFDRGDIEVSGIEVRVSAAQRKESITSFQYYAAAIMCMFLLYSAGIGGRALLDERREGTIPRLFVGGHGLEIIVISNFIRVMVLAVIQSSVMIIYSSLVLGVDWGKPTTVVLTVIVSSFAIAAIGMLIAVITLIANNYKVANAFEFGVVYLMALLGGSFIPVEGLPEIMQKLGFLSVNGLALKMYINGMYELPIGESLTYVGTLITFGILFIVASMMIIRAKGRKLAC